MEYAVADKERRIKIREATPDHLIHYHRIIDLYQDHKANLLEMI